MIDLAVACSFPTLSVFGGNFVSARYFPIYAVAKSLALDLGRLLTPHDRPAGMNRKKSSALPSDTERRFLHVKKLWGVVRQAPRSLLSVLYFPFSVAPPTSPKPFELKSAAVLTYQHVQCRKACEPFINFFFCRRL